MNGVHDMGGMDGFGPVVPEADEPIFHAPWEKRIFAFTRSMGFARAWTLDESRATQERLPPQVYLSVSYYKRWTLGFERLLVKHGFASTAEVAAGKSLGPGKPPLRVLTADKVVSALRRPSCERPARAPARFQIGDRVRTRNINPTGATRLPRYARNHIGTIDCVHGCHAYADSIVAGNGDDPQWLYTVVFSGTELWGVDTDPTVKVSIEAFEPYLEALPA
jgi:nitrile hydratase beta subunit